jgi:phosphomethylpyrimidine synthase
MKITQEVQDSPAKQNQSADAFWRRRGGKSMVEMSERFRDDGGEVYIPASG